MKYKAFGLLALVFVLVPTFGVRADDPTSKFLDLGQPSTVLDGPSSGVAVNVEIWDAAVGGTLLGTESHAVDTDSYGTITNDTGFGGFELGRGSGGVDLNLFQNAVASPISRYFDVTQAGVSVLPGGARIPFLTVPFALSVPLINSIGIGNLFAGVEAGLNNTSIYNTAIGATALRNNTTGERNTVTGALALRSNTAGRNNTAVGYDALAQNTTGEQNTASGANALFSNCTICSGMQGSNNTAIGYAALQNNSTGAGNTAIGSRALFNNGTGSGNTAIGANADVSTGDLVNATAIGAGAIVSQSNSLVLGNSNTHVGIGTTNPDLAVKLEVRADNFAANIFAQSSVIDGKVISGVSTATSGFSQGVFGRTNSPQGAGVLAYSAGVLPNNPGLQVYGSGSFTGTVSKAGGSFKIDHPLDPANKYLQHSFVESPDMMNVYNGNVVLDTKGEAWVELPHYFQALNKDFRYLLTSIGAPGPNLFIAEEISGSRFKIAGGKSGGKVSWQVTGIRKDPYAEKYRIPVETEKPAAEKGYYMHPELYDQRKAKGLAWAKDPKGMKRMVEEREKLKSSDTRTAALR